MAKIGVQSISYGFKATRNVAWGNYVHVEPIEEYPRALTKGVKVLSKDKLGGCSCLFMYDNLEDAERERRAVAVYLNALYTKNQEELYKRYVYEWTAIKSIAGLCFKPSYLYKMTFSANAHYNLMHKRVAVTPEKLLRVIQAHKAFNRALSMLSRFNENNCPYDYSLGRKPPL